MGGNIAEEYDNGYLMLKHLAALYRLNTEWTKMMAFAELISRSPDGMVLEDHLDKSRSLTEQIDYPGIELMSEKCSLLLMSSR
jgi:hypothetical protein